MDTLTRLRASVGNPTALHSLVRSLMNREENLKLFLSRKLEELEARLRYVKDYDKELTLTAQRDLLKEIIEKCGSSSPSSS